MVIYSFATKLSKDYISFYENGKECADVIIRAGREGSAEEFYAHSFVLLIRSTYFRKELKGIKENNDGNKIIIEKPDINPKLFDKILRYFYGGNLEFDEKNPKEMFEFFLITKELNVSELLDVLQNQFLKSPKQIYQNFSTTLQISSSHGSFKKLHEFCLKTIENSPEIIFKSKDFNLLNEDTLLVLLQNEKLKVEEIEKWESIIKWGISQTFAETGSSSSSSPAVENFADVSLWTRDKFRNLSNTLKKFIPLIKFYNITPEDFYEKVKPFKKIIEKPLFEDILKYHIVSSKKLDSTTSKPTSQPSSQANKSIIGRPRQGSSGMIGNIPNHGPVFNGALYLKGDFGREYGSICKGNAYTVRIRDIQVPFLVEELEVYQVIKEIHGSIPQFPSPSEFS
ncbi:3040_t:CDS:2 [Funneliformis geosporum]|uniref:3040_t:CDS:1 n=1 Tax=Funneliformis geosporum TaxID=1117311 RepID=A0A9W4SEF2_9GLOM|nr:3040_t:CDS:2 [Funneliformis geosporum]